VGIPHNVYNGTCCTNQKAWGHEAFQLTELNEDFIIEVIV
jgi:hypothetical protein